MPYTFRGNLRGFLCNDCFEAIAGQPVLLYRPRPTTNITAVAVSDEKDTFRPVSATEQRERYSLLIAQTTTDAEGNFAFELDEADATTAFDIDFGCSNAPFSKPSRENAPVQFHITTLYPQWRGERERGFYVNWSYAITAKWWCFIKGYYFDVWTICGKLINCETKKPLARTTVTAMDADLFTDDRLGTAVTDASGYFKINYRSADFRKNFIAFNLETDVSAPFLSSGPDVYFTADYLGTSVYAETKADRRNNVGYCLCVTLCSDTVIIPYEGDDLASAWLRIGEAFTIPNGPVLESFDAEGLAGAAKYGLTGVLRLTGQAPHKRANGNHVEYRFSVSHVTTPNGGPAPADANFTKIIGKTPNLLATVKVATLKHKVYPNETHEVFPNEVGDFDGEGWFDVNKAIERTLTAAGVLPADFHAWDYLDDDTLLALNTNALTTSPDVPPALANAGQGVPVATRMFFEKIAIRFEVREVLNKATNSYAPLPGSGQTLNSAVINNNSTFMKCVVNELLPKPCNPLTGTIHTAYTVHHPLLMYAGIYVYNNSLTVNKQLSDGFIELSGNTNNAVNHQNNPALQINGTPNDLKTCTYSLQLSAVRRLHNGDSGVGTELAPALPILFYYEE